MWTPNERNAAKNRQAWINRQNKKAAPPSGLDDFIPKEAGWISNEFIPPILDLIDQGYTTQDRETIHEMLLSQGLTHEAEYLLSFSEAEWEDFSDFALREGGMKVALVSDRLKKAYTRYLELVPEDIPLETAGQTIESAVNQLVADFELSEEEEAGLYDMITDGSPRMEVVVGNIRVNETNVMIVETRIKEMLETVDGVSIGVIKRDVPFANDREIAKAMKQAVTS